MHHSIKPIKSPFLEKKKVNYFGWYYILGNDKGKTINRKTRVQVVNIVQAANDDNN